MKEYEIFLTGKQYAVLEKMLSSENAGLLARNQSMDGRDFFQDILEEVYCPVEDGWCTLKMLLAEPDKKLNLLKFLTKAVFPNDENYFIRQLGKNFRCPEQFSIKISLI